MTFFNEPQPVLALLDRHLGDDAVVDHNVALDVLRQAIDDGRGVWAWCDASDGCDSKLLAFEDRQHTLILTVPGGDQATAQRHIPALVEARRGYAPSLTGVHGSEELVDAFVTCWQATGPVGHTERMPMLRYRQEGTPLPPEPPAGRMDTLQPADYATVLTWSRDFYVAVGLPHVLPDEQWLEQRLQTLRCWRVGDEAVSMAGFGRMVRDSVAITCVYTPPTQRGKGYASALVAHLASDLAATGFRHRLLFTDAANPTSNGIYQAIGFQQIGTACMCRLQAA